MANPLDNLPMEITCERCRKKTSKTVAWVRSHDLFTCPFCGEASVIGEQAKQTLGKAKSITSKFAKDIGKRNKR